MEQAMEEDDYDQIKVDYNKPNERPVQAQQLKVR